MVERRQFSRIEKSLVTYHRKLWQTSLHYAGLSKNISLNGILVDLDDVELKMGDLLSIELVLPNDPDEINIIGRICRREGRDYGIEFVNIDEADVKKLEVFLKPVS